MKILLVYSEAVDWLNERLGRLSCWLTLVMVLVASYNAIARYIGRFVGRNLTSNVLLEAQWYLFSAVFLLGAAYALKHNAHVRVDVVYDRLGPRARAWVNLTGTVLFLLPFSIFALWASMPAVISSWKILEVSPDPGGLPRYPIKALIPVGFVLIFLQGVSELIKLADFLRRGEGDSGLDDGEVGAP